MFILKPKTTWIHTEKRQKNTQKQQPTGNHNSTEIWAKLGPDFAFSFARGAVSIPHHFPLISYATACQLVSKILIITV